MPVTQDAPNPDDRDTVHSLRAKATSRAIAALREAHREEWVDLVATEYANVGLTYNARRSPEDKALDEVRSLLAQFPEIKDKL